MVNNPVNKLLKVKKLVCSIEEVIKNGPDIEFPGCFTFEEELYEQHVNIEELESELISGLENYEILNIEEKQEKFCEGEELTEEEEFSFEFLYSIKTALEDNRIELDIKEKIANITRDFFFVHHHNEEYKYLTFFDIETLKNNIIKYIDKYSREELNVLKENLKIKMKITKDREFIFEWINNVYDNLEEIINDINHFKIKTNYENLSDYINENINNFSYLEKSENIRNEYIKTFMKIKEHILDLQSKEKYETVMKDIKNIKVLQEKRNLNITKSEKSVEKEQKNKIKLNISTRKVFL